MFTPADYAGAFCRAAHMAHKSAFPYKIALRFMQNNVRFVHFMRIFSGINRAKMFVKHNL